MAFGGMILAFVGVIFSSLLLALHIYDLSKGGGSVLLLARTGFALVLFFMAYGFCRRWRSFKFRFGRWIESPAEDIERRHLLEDARGAYLEGDRELSARTLSRYLEQRPGHPEARLSLAYLKASMGRNEDAVEALRLAGDPYRDAEWLDSSRGWRHWPYSPRMATLYGSGALAPLLVLCGLVLGVYLVGPTFIRYRDFAIRIMHKGIFNTDGMQHEQNGAFSIYYSNPEFLKRTIPLAQDALDYNLNFFDLSQDQTPDITLILSANDVEYHRRSQGFSQPWQAGMADSTHAQIHVYDHPSYRGREAIANLEILLAHEISHLCFAKVLPNAKNDSWLNEGLADYVGYRFALGRHGYAMDAWLKANLFKSLLAKSLPFKKFVQSEPNRLALDDVRTFYQQGFSVVYVLIERFGKESFVNFLRYATQDGDLDRALKKAYPTIQGIEQLGGIWDLYMHS